MNKDDLETMGEEIDKMLEPFYKYNDYNMSQVYFLIKIIFMCKKN